METKKSNPLRKLTVVLAVLIVVIFCSSLYLNNYATPTIRTEIERPLFTVGDENYSVALEAGKKIVKFGPLPFGIYPGGVAFDNVGEAANYLREVGKVESGWDVYLLSGDFDLDTTLVGERRFTNKSLLVVKKANVGVLGK